MNEALYQELSRAEELDMLIEKHKSGGKKPYKSKPGHKRPRKGK